MIMNYDSVVEAVIKNAIAKNQLYIEEGEPLIKVDNKLITIKQVADKIFIKLGGKEEDLPC